MRETESKRPWRSLLVRWAAWWGLLALYLAFRRHLFGEMIGGYPEYAELLRHFAVGPRLREAAGAFAALMWPDPSRVGEDPLRLVLVYVPLVVAGLAAGWRMRSDPAGGRAYCVAALWVLLFLAPFGWTIVIPGTGRYAYLAAGGAAWLAVESVRMLLPAARRRASLGIAALALGLVWIPIFGAVRATYPAASKLANRARGALASTIEAADNVVFCAGYPLYLHDTAGTPMAAVFHYGLADSVHPPFGTATARVYALTEGVVEDLEPLLARGRGLTLLRWRAPGGGWIRERMRGGRLHALPSGGPLAVDGPPEGATWSADASTIHFAMAPQIEYSVVVVAEGNSNREPLAAAGAQMSLPADFLATMRHLYGSPVFWWVEGRDSGGRLVAFSVARKLRLLQRTAGGSG